MEKLHVQPSELDKLPYYELEYTVSIYNDILKERNDKEKNSHNAEMDKYNMDGLGDSTRNLMKGAGTPKMPSMPSIKMPKI
tara:strand:- start:284 stop:526 length:243 start_codon:yes stop_codon:yes gene_type:complete